VGVPSPPAIWMPDGRVITPDLRDAERLQGFRAGWTRPAERAGRASFRWRLVGNAVSVPVARWLGERLAAPGQYRPEADAEPVVPGRAWPTAAYNVGAGRFASSASEWPRRARQPALSEFLRYPGKPLSEKATAGFLERAARGCLRFPPGFIEALSAHLERMRRAARASAANGPASPKRLRAANRARPRARATTP
jgi:DNA (cytosine-5)-methyltransferase 1